MDPAHALGDRADVPPGARPFATPARSEQAYRDGYPRFVRVARAITGGPEAAADVVRDAFAETLRTREACSGDDAGVEGWPGHAHPPRGEGDVGGRAAAVAAQARAGGCVTVWTLGAHGGAGVLVEEPRATGGGAAYPPTAAEPVISGCLVSPRHIAVRVPDRVARIEGAPEVAMGKAGSWRSATTPRARRRPLPARPPSRPNAPWRGA